MENPIKMDDLGVPLFLETPVYITGKCLTPSQLLVCSSFSGENCIFLPICSSLSNSQITLGKLLLEGSNPKIEDKQVPGTSTQNWCIWQPCSF